MLSVHCGKQNKLIQKTALHYIIKNASEVISPPLLRHDWHQVNIFQEDHSCSAFDDSCGSGLAPIGSHCIAAHQSTSTLLNCRHLRHRNGQSRSCPHSCFYTNTMNTKYGPGSAGPALHCQCNYLKLKFPKL